MKEARICKKYSYWFVSKSKHTGEVKWAVGRYGPKMYIQGEERDVKKIVKCFNKGVCK